MKGDCLYKQYLSLHLMAISSINVFLMTSQVCNHFAQHRAEATFAFLKSFKTAVSGEGSVGYLVKSSFTLLNSIDEPVWRIAVVLMKNLPEIL